MVSNKVTINPAFAKHWHLKVRVLLIRFPVLLVVSIGVAHGMCILALYQRPRLCFLIGPCFNLHREENLMQGNHQTILFL